MPYQGLKGPKMLCFRILIPCPAHILDAPLIHLVAVHVSLFDCEPFDGTERDMSLLLLEPTPLAISPWKIHWLFKSMNWGKVQNNLSNVSVCCLLWGPKGELKIPLSRRFFAQITPRNCLKFMFTPSLPNHAGCQIDHSRNNAIFPIQFPFSRSKIYRITPSRFPLGGPLPTAAFQLTSVCLNLLKEISPRRKGGPNSRFHLCDGSGWIFRRIHT